MISPRIIEESRSTRISWIATPGRCSLSSTDRRQRGLSARPVGRVQGSWIAAVTSRLWRPSGSTR